MEEYTKKHGPRVLASADLDDYRRMQEFISKIPDMLRLIHDILHPNTLEDFLRDGFN